MIQGIRDSLRFNAALLLLFLWVLTPTVLAEEAQELSKDYEPFHQALEDGDEARALSLGQVLYRDFQQAYRSEANFQAFHSKLTAAEFLARQMISQLAGATRRQMLRTTATLFSTSTSQRQPLTLPPAQQFYDTSVSIFSHPVRIGGLTDKQKAFLGSYYDLKLRLLIARIARAGQALAIAEPQFHQTHHYVLILPLLHTSADQPININVLPAWMTKPEQLELLSDVCLLHFNLPIQAMHLAQQAANGLSQTFLPENFYRAAAKKCGVSQANVAVACLEYALAELPASAVDKIILLNFDIAQLWWDTGNFPLAAGQAQKIITTWPDIKEYGRAVNLYYYSLSRSNNVEAILTDINTAIDDARCIAYQAKLMYLKWWSLRRQRKDDARIGVIEHDLIKRYPKNSLVAPVLLSRATDHLGRQDYSAAKISLDQIIKQFPNSKAAVQAHKMITKLKNSPKRKG